MAMVLKIKSVKPKLKQDQLAKELGCSSSNLQRHRHDVKTLSTYRIPSNSHKRRQMISDKNLDDNTNHEHDLKRHQITSNDLKGSRTISNADSTSNNKKSKLKGGSMHEINQKKDEYSDEILHNRNL